MARMWVEREERDNGAEGEDRRVHAVLFSVMEEGVTWQDSDRLRPLITVEVWPPRPGFGNPSPEVTWPSTSDKRPQLALMAAAALTLAAAEAGLEDPDLPPQTAADALWLAQRFDPSQPAGDWATEVHSARNLASFRRDGH